MPRTPFAITLPALFTAMLMAVVLGCGSSSDGGAGDASPSQPDAAPEPAPAATAAPTRAPDPTPTPGKRTQWDVAPPLRIDPDKSYTATFNLERDRSFVVELFAKKAPKTVNNFVFLAREGYYDGTTFHRVIPGFMAQGGDPTGTGTGGPGYQFANEFHPDLRHFGPGILAMANSGLGSTGTGTNGSQFYITYSEQHRLDGLNLDGSAKECHAQGISCHSVFGQVVEGLNAAMSIREREPGTATYQGDRIISIEITESE